MKNSSSRVKAHTAFVIGVYPVTSLATYFAILVPRAHLLAEAITQGMFMAGMYQLFCLFVAYCGGEAELVKKVKPDQLSLKVGPCCCWPCCIILPTFSVTKKTVRTLRLLVLQLPLVQGLVYLILLVMWAERESLYQINYMYIQPIIITSILIGVWSMAMTINLLKISCEKYFLIGKFLVLQMVLIFAKLQGLSTRALVWFHVLPCRPPITPQVYANLLHNSLMLLEMVLLGSLARYLYKRSIPEIVTEPNRISTIGSIMTIETCNNNIVACNDFNKTNGEEKNSGNGSSGVDNVGADINE
ncbi:organic solute transporter alpha-like protein isoform X2 [Anoplophora glabripennis]|nr:organic solute transporter alpha-like protein isoform X2 [Anoplophora glabripennis]XP_018568731.1 organic solute transporter alpha-like protein isoform X2 [Anoplophora glabripennis]XP_018568732.1 organic solute transporter alpha-like protein isoform X2 [Anoplophora glabripennis]